MTDYATPPEVRPYVSPPLPSDGAPLVSPPPGHKIFGTNRQASRRFTFEGPRGLSTRATIWLRYASYLMVIVLASVITGACFASTPGAASGGQWMLLSAAFQLATAAVGSWFVPNHRPEIIQQVRAYVFGYTVLPGTGIAIFMWAAGHMTSSANSPDVFITAMQSALPWIFFLPIILPAVIFVKSVAGMRVINREQLDDQELMRVYTRNDGHQR
jgi:hypothetical protein